MVLKPLIINQHMKTKCAILQFRLAYPPYGCIVIQLCLYLDSTSHDRLTSRCSSKQAVVPL